MNSLYIELYSVLNQLKLVESADMNINIIIVNQNNALEVDFYSIDLKKYSYIISVFVYVLFASVF